MSKPTGFEIKAAERQSWGAIAMVWIGSVICVPALMIAQSDDDTAYHSPADTIDALSMDYIDTACAWCMALILSAVD